MAKKNQRPVNPDRVADLNLVLKTYLGDSFVVPLESIRFAAYQRDTDPARAAKIAREFDIDLFGMPVVSERGGVFWGVDCGHRALALKILGAEYLPCRILTGYTYEQEAGKFRLLNRLQKKTTEMQDFSAAQEEKDPMIIAINQAVTDVGLHVGKHGGINCYGAMTSTFKRYGETIFRQSLAVLREVPEVAKVAIPQRLLRPVALILDTFPQVDVDRLISTILRNYDDIDSDLRSSRSTGGNATDKAQKILDVYNKNLPHSKKLFLPRG